MTMQYTENFSAVKNGIFYCNLFEIFNIIAQSINCGYTLEPPRRGGSNDFPQSMFLIKTKKNRYTPENSSFSI